MRHALSPFESMISLRLQELDREVRDALAPRPMPMASRTTGREMYRNSIAPPGRIFGRHAALARLKHAGLARQSASRA
jgi:hypothetical protein